MKNKKFKIIISFSIIILLSLILIFIIKNKNKKDIINTDNANEQQILEMNNFSTEDGKKAIEEDQEILKLFMDLQNVDDKMQALIDGMEVKINEKYKNNKENYDKQNISEEEAKKQMKKEYETNIYRYYLIREDTLKSIEQKYNSK